MSADFDVTLGAKIAQFEAAWKASERRNEQLVRSFQKLQRQNDKNTRSLDKSAMSAAKFGAALNQGIALARQAMSALLQDQQQFIDKSAELEKTFDEAFTGFLVQTGFRRGSAQAEAAEAEINRIARANKIDRRKVSGVAKQLVSSGFSTEEVIAGGGAEVLTQGLIATAATGRNVDPVALTQAVTQVLNTQGKELTSENLAEAMKQVQSLFLQTNIQFRDLSDLVKAVPTLQMAGLSDASQSAVFSVLRDSLDSPEAATGSRQVFGRLQTAGATPSRVRALAEIGLRPEDVDFVGESEDEVFERLDNALSSLDAAKRAQISKKLFEERGVAAADILIRRRKEITRRRELAEQGANFEDSLIAGTTGPAAQRRGASVEADIALSDEGNLQFKSAEDQLQAEFDGKPVRRALVNRIFGVLQQIPGVSPERAASIAEAAGNRPDTLISQFALNPLPLLQQAAQSQAVNQRLDEGANVPAAPNSAFGLNERSVQALENIDRNTRSDPDRIPPSPLDEFNSDGVDR